MGSGGSGSAPPRWNAPYSALSSFTSTPSDHPSETMWCMVTISTWSSSATLASAPRISGPSARSKGAAASRAISRRSSASASSCPWRSWSTRWKRLSSARAMRCTGWPSPMGKVERSASCRATTRSSAAPRAARSSAPRSRSRCGMWYACPPAPSCSMNQSRCCANDSGSGCPRSAGSMPAARVPAGRSGRAKSASTWRSKRWPGATSTPSAWRTREITCIPSSECPPSSKKWSHRPTRSTLSTSRQMEASAVSTSPTGASYARATPALPSGAGSALRSTLPLGVSGSEASRTYAAGTMCSGTRPARCSRSASGSSGSGPAQ
ncbi:MAG: hypothetical protein AVDCRST_MAG68-4252 [uncultured Gemmatimonadetes bacterium]|uniref:Uncharacterized protein n=1 Tax=uncultured Gemmatimonadota bacterium TaxID=203437 RepID=A0A6J4MGL7_9BACT|nr:MAG: hypothetical protein AVDCRST_MAG68-4252 [uncultured Gemmatimonadota bacterium]